MRGQFSTFALTPLDEQSTHSLIVALLCVWLGFPLRPELRTPGLSDAETIRRVLRDQEWQVGR